MNGSKRSRRTTRPRWWSDLPGWERREIENHLDASGRHVRSSHRDRPMPLGELGRRRLSGEPLEYLLGHVHVGPLTLRTDDRALIPRPETETMVRRLVERVPDLPPGGIVDCGTGSGFLAGWIEEHTDRDVVAVDRYPAPLELADENRRLNGWRFGLVRGDRLEPVAGPLAAVVANLPYVLPGDPGLQTSVGAHEPDRAWKLETAPEAFYGKLLRQAARRLRPGGELWLELSPSLLDRLESSLGGSAWSKRHVGRDGSGRRRYWRFVRDDTPPGRALRDRA